MAKEDSSKKNIVGPSPEPPLQGATRTFIHKIDAIRSSMDLTLMMSQGFRSVREKEYTDVLNKHGKLTA